MMADVPAEMAYLCPPSLLLRARAMGRLAVAVAGANAAHVLESVGWARDFGLIEPILVGDKDWILRHMAAYERQLAGVRIVAADDEEDAARLAVNLVHDGEAKLLMKGHLHTDVLMRAALQPEVGLRTGQRLSHVFAMIWPGAPGYLLITDAALNVAPNPATMLHIVRHAVRVARVLEMTDPKIAMLSATEERSAAMASSMAAGAFADEFQAEAVALGCAITGPLALDVAISKHAAKIKGLQHDSVAGAANILVVPNIETGNALFKMLVHLKHATAMGVVLGASVPIILNSRADPAEAKLASIALARLAAEIT
ncbi:MAG: bifunctional enoyl-CoA hydratase/phosphate acetyltransferase [Acidocella sp.]|nr:bifunctional enoyl-CoA hydratase/phosphate acetyltransferase [Acidocella sp.]